MYNISYRCAEPLGDRVHRDFEQLQEGRHGAPGVRQRVDIEHLSSCATTTVPSLYSQQAATTEAHVLQLPRAQALQQEKPPQ